MVTADNIIIIQRCNVWEDTGGDRSNKSNCQSHLVSTVMHSYTFSNVLAKTCQKPGQLQTHR